MKGNRNMRGPVDKTVLKDGTLGRLIRMIFSFYPVLLPFTLACILVNAIITAIPSLFQQRTAARPLSGKLQADPVTVFRFFHGIYQDVLPFFAGKQSNHHKAGL